MTVTLNGDLLITMHEWLQLVEQHNVDIRQMEQSLKSVASTTFDSFETCAKTTIVMIGTWEHIAQKHGISSPSVLNITKKKIQHIILSDLATELSTWLHSVKEAKRCENIDSLKKKIDVIYKIQALQVERFEEIEMPENLPSLGDDHFDQKLTQIFKEKASFLTTWFVESEKISYQLKARTPPHTARPDAPSPVQWSTGISQSETAASNRPRKRRLEDVVSDEIRFAEELLRWCQKESKEFQELTKIRIQALQSYLQHLRAALDNATTSQPAPPLKPPAKADMCSSAAIALPFYFPKEGGRAGIIKRFIFEIKYALQELKEIQENTNADQSIQFRKKFFERYIQLLETGKAALV